MAKVIDHNNFWYIEKNPISKTGVFPYLGREIGYPGLEPNKIYYVLRSEKELMNPEAIKSFELLPITKGHRMLGPAENGLTPAENIPQQGIVGEEVFAQGDTLYANIKITSEQAKDDINNGLKELSLGYFCEWVKESGEYKGQHYDIVQKNIRGNHLAIVPRGRMGHGVRVMDALPAGAASYACDSLELSGPFVSTLLPAGHIPLKLFNLPGQAGDGDKITWITVKGNHIPIKEGQSKEEALKAFFDKKASESKAKNEEKTEKQDIFTPSAELAEKFKNEVQNVLADDKVSPRTELSLGETPQIYVNLGLPKGELKTNKMTLLKALGKTGKHPHNVPIKVLEELPALIMDPQAVFKSLSTSSNPSGYISVLDAVDKEGKPIIAVISPNKKDENEISFIPSVYERNNFNNFVSNVIKENGVLYIKERTVLPSLHNAVLQRNTVPTNKILTKEDFVKDLQDLDSTKTNGADGISAAPEKKENAQMDKSKIAAEILAIASKPESEFEDGKEGQMKAVIGLLDKVADNKSASGANDDKGALEEDKADSANPSEKDEKDDTVNDKAPCDKDKAEDALEARIMEKMAKKLALYEKVSPFIGSFDHTPMSLAQMAKYACDKLGIKGIAEDSAETALTGYLAGAQKQVVFREAVNGAVGDAMPVEKDAAFEKYLKEAN